MNKVSTSGVVAYGTDTTFRAFLADFHQLLTDCGLVRTSDTGQIVDASATWPVANNTDSGYSVWRFDDTLQATAPIFIKITYGRGNSATFPRGTIEVGVGTNGAGTITGLTSSTHMISTAGAGASTYPSYAIHREGLAGVAYKIGAHGSSVGAFNFIVQRSVDNNGDPTGDGAQIIRPASSPATLTSPAFTCRLRFSPTTQTTGFAAVTALPIGAIFGGITDGRVGLSPQVFPHWIMLPKQRPLIGSGASVRGEVSLGQEFSMTLVGASPLNYICVADAFGNTLIAGTSTNSDTMMLWDL